jgi:hypothetical protein
LHPDLRTKENYAKAKLPLTDREMDERARIAGLLKNYIEERLRDPETRALNISPQFRLAREELINAKTLEDLGRRRKFPANQSAKERRATTSLF